MRTILVLFIAGLVVTTLWYLSGGLKSGGSGLVNTMGLNKNRSMALHGVRLVKKKNNINEIELIAGNASMAVDKSRTILDNFSVLLGSKDMGDITFAAETGSIDSAGNDIEALNNVLIRDEMGRSLITDSLNLDNIKRVISTPDRVRIFGNNFLIAGSGMIAYIDEERVELLADVNAVFNSDG